MQITKHNLKKEKNILVKTFHEQLYDEGTIS